MSKSCRIGNLELGPRHGAQPCRRHVGLQERVVATGQIEMRPGVPVNVTGVADGSPYNLCAR